MESLVQRDSQEVYMQQAILDVITLLLTDERRIFCAIQVNGHQARRRKSAQGQRRTVGIQRNNDRVCVAAIDYCGQLACPAHGFYLLANHIPFFSLYYYLFHLSSSSASHPASRGYLRSVNRISAKRFTRKGSLLHLWLFSSEQYLSKQKHQTGKQSARQSRDQSGTGGNDRGHLPCDVLPHQEDRSGTFHMDIAPDEQSGQAVMDFCVLCDDRAGIATNGHFLRLDKAHGAVL